MSTESLTKKNILVVDDIPNNLTILAEALTNTGYNVFVANSGDRALYQVEHHIPDLILLDILMPGLDGFETCRRLKAKPDTAQIPVVFMTALDDVENTIKGFEAGGVDYINKPFRQAEVLARINTHLSIHALRQQLEVKNTQLHEKNVQLEEALKNVKLLSGMLPICSNCKDIRDDEGYWQDVAVYVRDHSEAMFTHSICPECNIKLYPELYEDE